MTDAGPSRVAIIPARGGSKRVPRKNARTLDGQPLISWAIAACRESGVFDDIVVSTDDDEIARIAEASGARVPFVRPADLADDHTPLVPVVAHAIRSLEEQGTPVTLACCVYPTAATLLPHDLAASLALLEASPEAPYVVGVVRYSHPVQRAMTRDPDGFLDMAYPGESQTRTQDLPVHWYDAGQFVWGRRQAWLDEEPVLPHALGHELPGWRALDLDTEDDWHRAEVIHEVIRTMRLG